MGCQNWRFLHLNLAFDSNFANPRRSSAPAQTRDLLSVSLPSTSRWRLFLSRECAGFPMCFHGLPRFSHSPTILLKAMSLVLKAVVSQKLSLLDLRAKGLWNLFLACKVWCLASCWACLASRPQCQACKISYLPTFWKSVVRPRNHHALEEKTVTNEWFMQPSWKAYRLRFVPVWVLEMHAHVIFLWWIGLFACSLTVPCQMRR